MIDEVKNVKVLFSSLLQNEAGNISTMKHDHVSLCQTNNGSWTVIDCTLRNVHKHLFGCKRGVLHEIENGQRTISGVSVTPLEYLEHYDGLQAVDIDKFDYNLIAYALIPMLMHDKFFDQVQRVGCKDVSSSISLDGIHVHFPLKDEQSLALLNTDCFRFQITLRHKEVRGTECDVQGIPFRK